MDTEILQHVALFDKCKNFTRAKEIQAAGLYPYFKPISESEDTVVVIDGQKKVMMGSNNYLGLTHHPRVLEAAKAALERYGSGCTGSRFLNGTLDLHERLETCLAEFFGKDAALVFSTGYQANLGLISCLIGRGDVVLLDKLDHASIVDGAKMSFGETSRFNHGDLKQLERLLQRHAENGVMIIVDGIYSMEGNIADVPNLVKLAQQYGAALALDDAHSVGVLGPKGEGTAAHFGLSDDVDIIVGTFSKSLASIGGFVAGSESVVHYLKHHSRPLIFTAALPPANTAGVLAALEVMIAEPERRDRLWENTRRLHEGFRSLGFDIGPSQTPIVPVLIGPLERTFMFWRKLFDAGVFTNPVVPPAVPPSECRLRTSLMATHTPEQIDFALDTFAKLGKEMGVILSSPVVVRPVQSARDLKRFIAFPYQLHRGDPQWVPQLRMDVRTMLSRTKNPFFEHSEAEYFLAERDGNVVGRIAAIQNRQHNNYYNDKVGFFGFFETIDDQLVANALFEAAAGWLTGRGLTTMRGPTSFSTNDECGLLVEGFDTPPTLLNPHNPAYYVPLVERAGFTRIKDMYQYRAEVTDHDMALPERLVRGAELVAQRHKLTARKLDMKRFEEEVERIKQVYNSAWDKNWGFVPMTDAEIDHLAKQLKPIVVPEGVVFVEQEGKLVGFAAALPDFNVALKKNPSGRLFPGIIRILLAARKIKRTRILLLGLLPEYRKTGAEVLMYKWLWEKGYARGWRWGEAGWILEDNPAMNNGLLRMGFQPYKTLRLYDRGL